MINVYVKWEVCANLNCVNKYKTICGQWINIKNDWANEWQSQGRGGSETAGRAVEGLAHIRWEGSYRTFYKQ